MKKIIFIINVILLTNTIFAKLPEVKVTENVLYVTPKTQISLPNGAMDLSLKENYKRSIIDFSAKYDFIDNFMGFNLDFGYDLKPTIIGISMFDKADFSEIYANQETIARDQSIGPYMKNYLSKNTYLQTKLTFEKTVTMSATTLVNLEKGNNVLGNFGIFSNTYNEIDGLPEGKIFYLNFKHSFRNLGSDYEYTNAELEFKKFFHIFNKHFLELQIMSGYPLYTVKKPIYAIYYAGGYQILKGYDFKEFFGDSIVYDKISYNFSLPLSKNLNFLGISFSILTLKFYLENAKLGDENIFYNLDNIKSCLGSGVEYNVTFFKILPMKLEIVLAQAIDNRSPKLYFTIATTYYTWNSAK